MSIRNLMIVSFLVTVVAAAPALAVFKSVASPDRAEFGFEQPAPGTDIFTLGGPPWANIGSRLTGVVQTGDGAGGGAAGAGTLRDAGLQSAHVTVGSSNARMVLNASPRMLPAHTGRFSFAFQAPVGDNDYEFQVYLDSVSPDTSRSVWISGDNGVLTTRDEAAGNAHTFVANYEAGKWYEILWEKPVWTDGAIGQPFTVSLFDSSNAQLVGSAEETLGEAIENFGSWQIAVANTPGMFMNLDHFRLEFDDEGLALPTFLPRGPEPASLAMISMAGLMLLRRSRRA